MFFNTTNESGVALRTAHARTLTQEEIILNFFKLNKNKAFSPEEVQTFCLPKAPITSIRRALTVLTEAKKLFKTGEKKVSKWKVNTNTWKWTDES